MIRIGTGVDVHSFTTGRPLVVGGVMIPHAAGLAGHSDADVLAHAIADALLGAAALGDLGAHFPSTDPALAGMSSLVILSRVRDLLASHGWHIGNIDAVVIAESPRLAPHLPAMTTALGAALGVESGQISVKATTTDRLGSLGRGEGIAAQAVALIESAAPAAGGAR
jgi:2-C-methyl-D-erythritol 2,4-cyclodiphosphate synthase